MARQNQDENNGRLLGYAAMHKRGEIAVVPLGSVQDQCFAREYLKAAISVLRFSPRSALRR
jgi:hypothetical protein